MHQDQNEIQDHRVLNSSSTSDIEAKNHDHYTTATPIDSRFNLHNMSINSSVLDLNDNINPAGILNSILLPGAMALYPAMTPPPSS